LSANKQTVAEEACGRAGEMSIAVPVILIVLLSAHVYRTWQPYEFEQQEKSEQSEKSSSQDKSEEESSSKKDKSEKADKSPAAVVSKTARHRRAKRKE